MNTHGPFAWFNDNADGMALAFVAAFSSATVAHFLRGARGVSVMVALLAAFMLVGTVIPALAIFYGLAWYWWPPFGGGIGFAAISIAWVVIRFTARLESRAEDIADRVVDRYAPGKATDAPADKTGGQT